ncbi:MAG: ATP-binding cassette domain-containing protein [Actinobacteria bacterium]|nr:ATP-binding cassette domain-containing protein [Actinomycetota bacterium]
MAGRVPSGSPDPAGPILAADHISLLRGGRTVLDDVAAGFQQGAVTAIVGPSGAGKTSLLRCFNRLEQPERGTVRLEGSDIRALDPTVLRRRVGMIFQTPVVFEGGVRANLAYGLEQSSDDELAGALEAAGLPASFLDRSATALSVGQAQRVCIARALVRRPQVLLMDEPTSALDVDASRVVEATIARLGSSGLTVVLVTHDLAQARRLSRRALLLSAGEVVGEGSMDVIEAAWGAWPRT